MGGWVGRLGVIDDGGVVDVITKLLRVYSERLMTRLCSVQRYERCIFES